VTDFDVDMLEVAAQLLAEFGKTVTAYVPAVGRTYDPATGTTSGGEDSFSVLTSPPVPERVRERQGDVVVAREVTAAYIAAEDLQFTPTVGMRVVFNGESHRAVEVSPLHSGDQIAAYHLTLES